MWHNLFRTMAHLNTRLGRLLTSIAILLSPVYALSIPEVYKTWRWTEQYPGAKELQEYFKHVDKCIDVSKDTLYHTRVSKAAWNEQTHKWDIDCDNDTRITSTHMHCCLGFAAKRHFPDCKCWRARREGFSPPPTAAILNVEFG